MTDISITQPNDSVEKFGQALARATRPFVDDLHNKNENRGKILEIIENILFDEPGIRNLGLEPSPKEHLLIKLLFGYSEIRNAFTVLSDIVFYLKRFPPKNLQISRQRFLKYHIGNYLNEVYILRERLDSYQKIIVRMYRGNQHLSELEDQLKLMKVLLSTFKGLTQVRGKHVHEGRYTDEDFDRLDLYELIFNDNSEVQGNYSALFEDLYNSAVQEYRRKWINIIVKNNKNTEKILLAYFGVLYQIVFDRNDEWVAPTKSQSG